VFGRAREQREERTARGMRTAIATIEPGGNGGSSERVLEKAGITPRCTNENRDLVEPYAAPRLVEDTPRDLDRFAAFSRR
jgi:hypothetical protein